MATVSVALVGVFLAGCSSVPQPSQNETACKLFMSAVDYYNKVVNADNANRTDQTVSDLQTMLLQFPTQIQNALDKATGDVAVKLQTIENNATRVSLNSADQTAVQDLLASIQPTFDACTTDGVELVPTK